jgi:hypothetical protein
MWFKIDLSSSSELLDILFDKKIKYMTVLSEVEIQIFDEAGRENDREILEPV